MRPPQNVVSMGILYHHIRIYAIHKMKIFQKNKAITGFRRFEVSNFRALYMLAASSGWPIAAKKNGLKKKDLYRKEESCQRNPVDKSPIFGIIPIFDSLKRVKVPQSLCLSGVGAFVVYNVKCVYTSEKEARPPLRSRRDFI